ncbi:hypothetical protein B566_EDAN009649 [Ephemera danica]|nr:hypothetical protein B566_EDAN009649 [Ephemera danica]
MEKNTEALNITNLRTAFDLLDRDRDGRVTAGELQHMLENLGIPVRAEMTAQLLAQASRSGASLVDESEFLQWVSHMETVAAAAARAADETSSTDEHNLARESSEDADDANQDLIAAFRVFDRDSNGFITMDELRSAMEMIGESVTEMELGEMLALADIDRDGRINYEEFAKLLS